MQRWDAESLIYKNACKQTLETISEQRRNKFYRNYKYHRASSQRQQTNRRKTERIVFKSGHFNIEKSSSSKYRVFPDIVTLFIEARWRFTLLYCFCTYLAIWLTFAGIWWMMLYFHGDLDSDHLPQNNITEWTPCVREIYGFTSVFLFSIEIHTTIGYGTRSLTLKCPEAIFVMCIESLLGTIVQSFIIGAVFAKLTRPKNRTYTIMFSKHAIINQRDRELCFIFRVGNTRKARIISVKIRAILIKFVSQSADRLRNEQIELDLTVDSSADIFFMFPVSAVHKINRKSPFFSMSAYEMLKSNIEVLVVFEGIIESTGQPVQARSSYTSHEILWGHRFLQLMSYRNDKRGFVVDYSKFEETLRINTPLCSAQELHAFHSSTRSNINNCRKINKRKSFVYQ